MWCNRLVGITVDWRNDHLSAPTQLISNEMDSGSSVDPNGNNPQWKDLFSLLMEFRKSQWKRQRKEKTTEWGREKKNGKIFKLIWSGFSNLFTLCQNVLHVMCLSCTTEQNHDNEQWIKDYEIRPFRGEKKKNSCHGSDSWKCSWNNFYLIFTVIRSFATRHSYNNHVNGIAWCFPSIFLLLCRL